MSKTYTKEEQEYKDILISDFGKDNVWDTQELQELFTVHSFLAPYVNVTRKSDGANGSIQFNHSPRFYFNFKKGS